MKKVVDYLFSCLYLLYFGLLLLLFHVLQVIAYNVFGKRAHKHVVDYMNGGIMVGWYLTGSTVRYRKSVPLPTDRPIIFVANHQSMFDISPIYWFLRQHSPVFVSKVELAHGIPSVSYNLRKSGAALINRSDPKQAITEIARLGKLIQQETRSVVIFPEGTRSPSGQLRPFVPGGVSVLLKRAPKALVVPIAIRGTGRFNPKGLFPLRSFTAMSWTVLPAIDPAGQTPESVVQQAHDAISTELAEPQSVL